MVLNLSKKWWKWCLGVVSERSWELLGHPWGLKVGPRVDFDGLLEHFRLPFWMFSDKKSVFVRTDFLTSCSMGVGNIFGAFCVQFWTILDESRSLERKRWFYEQPCFPLVKLMLSRVQDSTFETKCVKEGSLIPIWVWSRCLVAIWICCWSILAPFCDRASI